MPYDPLSEYPLSFMETFFELKPDHHEIRRKKLKYVLDSFNDTFRAVQEALSELHRLYDFDGKNPNEVGHVVKHYPDMIYLHTTRKIDGQVNTTWRYFPTNKQREHLSEFGLEKNFDFTLRTLMAAYANNDPLFGIGGSKRNAETMRYLQYELDYDKLDDGEVVNEDFLLERINWDLLAFLRRHGVNPHFILTGNRSPHVALYFENPIRKTTVEQFLDSIKRLLVVGGQVDASSIKGSGIRFPLSYHPRTGGLCRYLGNLTREDVIATMRSVKKDTITDDELLRLSELVVERFPYIVAESYGGLVREYVEIPSVSGKLLFRPSLVKSELMELTKREEDPEGHRRDLIKWSKAQDKRRLASMEMTKLWGAGSDLEDSDFRSDEMTADNARGIDAVNDDGLRSSAKPSRIPPSDENTDKARKSVALESPGQRSAVVCSENVPCPSASPFCKESVGLPLDGDTDHDNEHSRIENDWTLNHPERRQFESYLRDGIPDGCYYDAIIKGDFALYVCHLYNSAEIAHEVIAALFDKREPQKRAESLSKIEARLEFLSYRPRPKSAQYDGAPRWQDIALSIQEQRWLDSLEKYFIRNSRNYRQPHRDAYMLTAQYILKKCHLHPLGVHLGATDLMKEFGWVKSTARKRFSFFTTCVRILVLTEYAVPHAKKATYVRVADLPPIDDSFVAGKRKTGTRPTKAKIRKYLDARSGVDDLTETS